MDHIIWFRSAVGKGTVIPNTAFGVLLSTLGVNLSIILQSIFSCVAFSEGLKSVDTRGISENLIFK